MWVRHVDKGRYQEQFIRSRPTSWMPDCRVRNKACLFMICSVMLVGGDDRLRFLLPWISSPWVLSRDGHPRFFPRSGNMGAGGFRPVVWFLSL